VLKIQFVTIVLTLVSTSKKVASLQVRLQLQLKCNKAEVPH